MNVLDSDRVIQPNLTLVRLCVCRLNANLLIHAHFPLARHIKQILCLVATTTTTSLVKTFLSRCVPRLSYLFSRAGLHPPQHVNIHIRKYKELKEWSLLVEIFHRTDRNIFWIYKKERVGFTSNALMSVVYASIAWFVRSERKTTEPHIPRWFSSYSHSCACHLFNTLAFNRRRAPSLSIDDNQKIARTKSIPPK